MRRIIMLAALALASSTLVSVRAQGGMKQTPVSRAEGEVLKLERAWLDAYEQRDVAAMERIVADDFTITFPEGGVQTKSQIIAQLKAPRRSTQPSYKFFTEDVQSRAYGETVILIGRVITQYERDGKTVRDQSRYTDTYVKRNGRWQVVASHLSNIAPERKP